MSTATSNITAVTEPTKVEVRELTREDLLNSEELVGILTKEEAVHRLGKDVGRSEIDDLMQRVAADDSSKSTSRKRAFALYADDEAQPRFVVYTYLDKIAQVDGVSAADDYPANMADILLHDNDHIEKPNIAVCYSITNLSPKKKGVKGAQLLGAVYDKLQEQGVSEVVTLSPMPQFESWLSEKVEQQDSSMLDGRMQTVLKRLSPGSDSPVDALLALYQDDAYNTLKGDDLGALNYILEEVGRYYVLEGTQSEDRNGVPIDPTKENVVMPFDGVQRFHMGNGAEIAKITAQRRNDDERVLVTGKREASQNKLNINYRYVPERERSINNKQLSEAHRPASDEIETAHVEHMGRVAKDLTQNMTLPTASTGL